MVEGRAVSPTSACGSALHELGVDVDAIGGASIGAAMGSLMAIGISHEQLVGEVAELFHGLLLDCTVPVVSLIKGERISRNIAVGDRGRRRARHVVAVLRMSTEPRTVAFEVHDRGDAATAIRASVAIPGILPPVPYDGELLVDGGVLQPAVRCDAGDRGGAQLIAVDLCRTSGPRARETSVTPCRMEGAPRPAPGLGSRASQG